jgi:hypothetical protein
MKSSDRSVKGNNHHAIDRNQMLTGYSRIASHHSRSVSRHNRIVSHHSLMESDRIRLR